MQHVQYQALWRINRTTSPHRERTGAKIVKAPDEDTAKTRVRKAVCKNLTGCREDDVCVYSIKRVRN